MKTAFKICPHFSNISSEGLHTSDYKLYTKMTRLGYSFGTKINNTEEKLISDFLILLLTGEKLKRNYILMKGIHIFGKKHEETTH